MIQYGVFFYIHCGPLWLLGVVVPELRYFSNANHADNTSTLLNKLSV